jgi:hypothetical protein
MTMRAMGIGALAAIAIFAGAARAQTPGQQVAQLINDAGKAHMAGDYGKALDLYQKILDSKDLAASVKKDVLYYNIACAKALKGKKEALEALALAFQSGWSDLDQTRKDPDLASLHGDPRFEALVKGSGAAPAAGAKPAADVARPAEAAAPAPVQDLGSVTLDFKFKTIDDTDFDWSTVRGKVVALFINGTWHSQVKKATPFLVKFAKDHESANFAIVGLQFELLPIDEDNIKDTKDYRKEFDVPWPMLYAGDFDAMATAVPFVREDQRNRHPIVVLFDTKGKARQMLVGTLDEAAFSKAVEQLLAESK